MQSKTVGTRWSLPGPGSRRAPSHYNPDRENAPVREDHRPPASVLSLKGVRRQGKIQNPAWRIRPQRSQSAPGKTPALLSGPGGAVRGGDRGSAHLRSAPAEFEVFRYGRLSATHTRRLHSSRDSGPRSGCGRSCSQVAGGGGWQPQAPDPGHLFSPSSTSPGSGRPAPPASRTALNWQPVP